MSGVLKGLSESVTGTLQGCWGGFCSRVLSLGAVDVALTIASSLVLLVILDIGVACRKDTPLGFLEAGISEMLGKQGFNF